MTERFKNAITKLRSLIAEELGKAPHDTNAVDAIEAITDALELIGKQIAASDR